MKPFFSDAIDIMKARSDELFSNKGQNVEKNPKWADLKPRTIQAREKRWGYYKSAPNSPTTMRWTGRLQDNVLKKVFPTAGILQYLQDYAIYHQEGSSKLPQRAIIDLSNGTAMRIIKALQKKINDDIKIFGRQL